MPNTMVITFFDGNTRTFLFRRNYTDFKITDGTLAIYFNSSPVAIYAEGSWKTVEFTHE